MNTIYFRNIRGESLEEVPAPRRGAWLSVISPSKEDLEELEKKYNLDADLLDDGIDLYESPRIEHEDGNIYIYVRFSRPEGDTTSKHP